MEVLRVKSATLLLTILALCSLSVSQNSHAFLWTQTTGLEDIGTMPGFENSLGEGINLKGEIVGIAHNTSWSKTKAFRWTKGTGWHDIPALGTSNSNAFGINNSGERLLANTWRSMERPTGTSGRKS
jgi:probable HAF family extracellular repeat protein